MTFRKLTLSFVLQLSALAIGSYAAFGQATPSSRDCSTYPYAPPFPAAPTGYTARYHGIGQELVDREKGVGPVTSSEYAILDALLDEAKQRLKPNLEQKV